MSFIADKQTLEDLNLLGKYKPNSIFSFFNRVQTAGGEKVLLEMFEHPLTDSQVINTRSSTFRFFQEKLVDFPFDKQQLEIMDNYLQEDAGSNVLAQGVVTIKRQLQALLVKDEEHDKVKAGIKATLATLSTCRGLTGQLQSGPHITAMAALLAHPQLQELPPSPSNLSTAQVIRFEQLFRRQFSSILRQLLRMIYQLDVFISVAKLSRTEGFCYATMLPAETSVASAKNMRYPGLRKAIGNDVVLDHQRNVLFLTGANMAGKSTFMKTFGVAVYMAHIGFPVAADEMRLSVKEGIYSSINVPDSLGLGLSHFYAEVMRVKQVALDVAAGKNLLVIFDELFKGTNVKDAYDATLAVTTAFSAYDNCLFIISTHIIEVGEALSGVGSIRFLYMPTVMEGNVPRYTYRLQPGITADRQGMTIIENEGILQMIQPGNLQKP